MYNLPVVNAAKIMRDSEISTMHSGEMGLWGLVLAIAELQLVENAKRMDDVTIERWENDGGRVSIPPPARPTVTEQARQMLKAESHSEIRLAE